MLMKFAFSGLKSLQKERKSGYRTWILCFVLTLSIQSFVESGNGVVKLMFYKIQYKVDLSDLSYLMMFYSLLTIVSQLIILPILSGRLKIKDTSIIIFAMSTNIFGHILFALSYDLLLLLVAYIVWAFYANISTTTRSCLTKFIDHTEIGGVLSIISILQSLLPILSKPFYGFLYKNTVAFFPATYLFVSVFLLIISILAIIWAHMDMRRKDGEIDKQANQLNIVEN